jgi:hypothetical protein
MLKRSTRGLSLDRLGSVQRDLFFERDLSFSPSSDRAVSEEFLASLPNLIHYISNVDVANLSALDFQNLTKSLAAISYCLGDLGNQEYVLASINESFCHALSRFVSVWPKGADPPTLKLIFYIIGTLCEQRQTYVQWFADCRVDVAIIDRYRESTRTFFYAASKVLRQFVRRNLNEPVSHILAMFMPSALNYLAFPNFTSPDQLAALEFVSATIATIENIESQSLTDAFSQIDVVVCTWEIPPHTLASAIWCWHSLLTNDTVPRTAFLKNDFISRVCALLGQDWAIADRFETCPICPILHCCAILFEPPQHPVFLSAFPFARLVGFAKCGFQELELLALSVVAVITNRAIELVPALLESNLFEALDAAASGTYDSKVQLCSITANLMFLEQIDLLAELFKSVIFTAVIENVPQLEVGAVKTIFRALAFGLNKIAKTPLLPEIRQALNGPAGEMFEELEPSDDVELGELVGRIRTILFE